MYKFVSLPFTEKKRIVLRRFIYIYNYIATLIFLFNPLSKICKNTKSEDFILSLTSFGVRIRYVYLAISSVTRGRCKPNKAILWLANEEKGKKIPFFLRRLQKKGLVIAYYKDIKSYKKLIPTLKKHPESNIITIDDDLIYSPKTLNKLINYHDLHPKSICACRIRKITIEKDKISSYQKWELSNNNTSIDKTNFATTGGGTLFPAGCFDSTVFDEKCFTQICPYADDIWFYAMALKNDYFVAKVPTKSIFDENFIEIIPLEKAPSLASINVQKELCYNDIQFDAVMSHFSLYDKIIPPRK